MQWSEESALLIAQRAQARLGLAGELQLMSFSTNAIFHAETDELVLRIARADILDVEALGREVSLALWLQERGFPVIRPAVEVSPAPFDVDGFACSVWRYEKPAQAEKVSPFRHGELMKQFHSLTDSYPYPLPAWLPGERGRILLSGLAEEELLDSESLETLWRSCEATALAVSGMDVALPQGVIHCDFGLQNLLVSERGPLLGDFELCRRGPREWDVVGATHSMDETRREEFFRGYGHDAYRESDLTPLIMQIKLSGLLWRADKIRLDIDKRPEILSDIQWWREEGIDRCLLLAGQASIAKVEPGSAGPDSLTAAR